MFEITFTGIDSQKILFALKQLSNNGEKITNVTFSGTPEERNYSEVREFKYIDDMFKAEEDTIVVFVNLDFLPLKGIQINNPSLFIHRDEQTYTFLIIFNEDDIIINEGDKATLGLIEFSKEVAEMLKAESYYAGLEPAEDEATRIFTGDVAGPYAL
ncbi:MAG: hypothetical protein L7U87_06700 [Chlamydiales bacterium]|nr:hypothetical protein [Chlamydiales bacterium]